ncbi:MAG: T9SS type A sorting domain-containing protein [candidate division KSB1 bacterium]|nr:T9SS type A sorting domain-containing protein [candidate division KSB1 bacterium]
MISQIKIYSFYPTDLAEIRKPEIIEFSIRVTDQGASQLNYQWSVDGVPEPVNTNRFSFYSTKYARGDHIIKVIVTDGISSDSLTWNTVVTKVELSAFEAQSLPFEGIQLVWETANEVNNAGFNVLRSNSEAGPFEKVNPRLIPASPKGHYTFTDSTAAGGHTFYYKLEDQSISGYSNQSEAIRVKAEFPEEYKLLQNFPNPFNPETNIRFQLPEKSDTRISIYNIRGQLVRTLVNSKLAPGYYELSWNGKNNQNMQVASGVYYYRFQSNDYQAIKKMVLLK